MTIHNGPSLVDTSGIPVFILCGGLGTRLKEETEFRPKPMVTIGSDPILLHIMKLYSASGFKNFVLCLGFKGDMIKSYFVNYSWLKSDLTVELLRNEVRVRSAAEVEDWRVTLVDTGETAMTGARIARAAARYLDGAANFAVTYGDGLTNVDLANEFAFHCSHGKTGTVLGVNPPSRFGELLTDGDDVVAFEEKPTLREARINGGFFFFRREFSDYLSEIDSCVLEREPLVRLAENREMQVYRHDGFWACMDTQRDRDELNRLWASEEAPWIRSSARSATSLDAQRPVSAWEASRQ